MNKTNHLIDFSQIDEITCGDPKFRKELIDVFMEQIVEFTENMNKFWLAEDMELLARESHTAKSSVMIFGMENTGHLLKKIQLLAEENNIDEIPNLLQMVESDLSEAFIQLKELSKNL